MLLHEWTVHVATLKRDGEDDHPPATAERVATLERVLQERVRAMAAIADASTISKNGAAVVKKEDLRACIDPRALEPEVQLAVWGSAEAAAAAAAALDKLKPLPIAASAKVLESLVTKSGRSKHPAEPPPPPRATRSQIALQQQQEEERALIEKQENLVRMQEEFKKQLEEQDKLKAAGGGGAPKTEPATAMAE
jgi:hypothetical protein